MFKTRHTQGDERLNIVQIDSTFGEADSHGRTTKEMHQWLTENHFGSIVFCGSVNDGKEVPDNVYIFSEKINRKIHALLSRISGLQGYFSIWDTTKIIRKLKKQKTDIVVLRVLHSNCINFPILYRYLSKNNIAVVFVLHDCFFYTGHCCYYLDYKCNKWKSACCECGHMKDWNKSWFFNTSRKCLKDKKNWYSRLRYGVVGVSEWVAKDVRYSVMKNAFVIEHIYNWIDFDTFYPRGNIDDIKKQNHLDGEKKIVLAVACVWTKAKGLDEVICASRNIADATFVVVGEAKEEFAKEDNIVFVGKISDKLKLAELYSIADVFINGSIQETFGKTTAEALSCGTPVVAYNTSGSAELVNDLRGGVVPVKDMKRFMRKVEEVLDYGKDYYKTNCLEFAKQNFQMESNMRKYLALFGKLNAEIS